MSLAFCHVDSTPKPDSSLQEGAWMKIQFTRLLSSPWSEKHKMCNMERKWYPSSEFYAFGWHQEKLNLVKIVKFGRNCEIQVRLSDLQISSSCLDKTHSKNHSNFPPQNLSSYITDHIMYQKVPNLNLNFIVRIYLNNANSFFRIVFPPQSRSFPFVFHLEPFSSLSLHVWKQIRWNLFNKNLQKVFDLDFLGN